MIYIFYLNINYTTPHTPHPHSFPHPHQTPKEKKICHNLDGESSVRL